MELNAVMGRRDYVAQVTARHKEVGVLMAYLMAYQEMQVLSVTWSSDLEALNQRQQDEYRKIVMNMHADLLQRQSGPPSPKLAAESLVPVKPEVEEVETLPLAPPVPEKEVSFSTRSVLYPKGGSLADTSRWRVARNGLFPGTSAMCIEILKQRTCMSCYGIFFIVGSRDCASFGGSRKD
jgi:hypothetical protein